MLATSRCFPAVVLFLAGGGAASSQGRRNDSRWMLPVGTGTGPYLTIGEWVNSFEALYPEEVTFELTAVGSGASQAAMVGDVDCVSKYKKSALLCGERPVANSTPFGAGGGFFDDDWYTTYSDLDLQLLPVLAGPIVVVYGKDVTGNLGDAADARLNLTMEDVADIFGGRILYWDAREIQASNPQVVLPHERINVVVRSDKSGMSASFTKSLAYYSPWWTSVPGFGADAVGKKPKWPLSNFSDPDDEHFVALDGQQALAVRALRTPFSITYLDLAESQRFSEFLGAAHLLNNFTEQFVKPTTQTIQAAMDAYVGLFEEPGSTMAVTPLDPRRPDAYPITRFIYWYVKKSALANGDCYRAWMVKEFVSLSYTQIAVDSAEKNHWVVAPESVAAIARSKLLEMRCLHPETGLSTKVADYVPPRRRECRVGEYIQAVPGGEGIHAYAGCSPCPAGMYQPIAEGLLIFSCLACPAGKASNMSGQSECTTCSPGRAQNATGQYACEVCQPGTFSVNAETCQVCERGSFARAPGLRSCELCPFGMFANWTGSRTCMSCRQELGGPDAAGAWATMEWMPAIKRWSPKVGAVDIADCGCDTGFFVDAAGGCAPCGEGIDCPGMGQVHVHPGFFAAASNPGHVFRCFGNLLGCPGGAPGLCAEGRDDSSTACSKCLEGHHESSEGTCARCKDGDVWPLAIICILVPIGAVVIYHAIDAHSRVKQKDDFVAAVIMASQFITVSQQFAVVSMLNIEWLEPFSTMMQLLGFISFDIEQLKVSCFAAWSVPAIYALRAGFVLLLLVLMVIVHFGFVLFWHRVRWSDHWASLVGINGTCLMVFFIPVLSNSLAPYQCLTHPNAVKTIGSYPSVACFQSGEYSQMVVVSIASLSIPVFFLCACIYVVVHYAHWMAAGKVSVLQAFSFIFIRFRTNAYWFALPLLLRNLLMCLCPTLPGIIAQTAIFTLTIMLWGLAVAHYVPMRSLSPNHFEVAFAIVLTLLMVMAPVGEAENLAQVAWLSLVLSISGFVALFVGVCLAVFSRYRLRNEFQFFICHHKGGAGGFARLLKFQLAQHHSVRRKVFIDSDDLSDLDRLFHFVRSETDTLVLICTKAILTRPWCVGELVNCHQNVVPVRPVVFPDFSPPSEEDIRDYFSHVPGLEVLADYGICDSMVKDMLVWLSSLSTICFRVQICLPTLDNLATQLMSQKVHANTQVEEVEELKDGRQGESQIAIVAHHTNLEAMSAAWILYKLIMSAMLHLDATQVPTVLRAGANLADSVQQLVLVMSNGFLQAPDFVRAIVASFEENMKVIPVVCDPNFQYPTEQFYQEYGMAGPRLLTEAKLAQPTVELAAIVKTVFLKIAINFNTHDTEEVIQARANVVVKRLTSNAVTRQKSGVRTSMCSHDSFSQPLGSALVEEAPDFERAIVASAAQHSLSRL